MTEIFFCGNYFFSQFFLISVEREREHKEHLLAQVDTEQLGSRTAGAVGGRQRAEQRGAAWVRAWLDNVA